MNDTLDNKLYTDFFERRFIKPWKEESNVPKANLELIVSPVCNTKCTYCYYKNFQPEIYPLDERCGHKNLSENLDKVIKWINKNDFKIERLELFSGEFFNLPFFEEFLTKLLELTSIQRIMLPTNSTFLFSEERTKRVENLLNRYPGRIALSLSFDGIYTDNFTRPLRNGNQYPEDFYDKVFEFAAKYNFHFHPMISAPSAQYWKKTFLWFKDNIKKYFKCDTITALNKVYLLEVRNPDWTDEQLDYLKDFLDFLTDYCFDLFPSPEKFVKNVINSHFLNIFHPFVGGNQRGMGCSIQNTLQIRLSDLEIVPCHRTAYEGYLPAKMVIDEEGNLSLNTSGSHSPLLGMMVWYMNFRNSNSCANCPIRYICTGPCWGCNYEVTGDFFKVPETVCKLEKTKIFKLSEKLEEKGILTYMINNPDKVSMKESSRKEIVNTLRLLRDIIRRSRTYGIQ